MKTSLFITLGLLTGSLTALAQFNSGSTGTVALHITADTALNLPPDGVLHYTTITVESNATLRFNRNSNNTPVYLLATGDVSISGMIDVSGGNAPTTGPRENGKGGPGGFDGGWPGDDTAPAGDGYGPGGGRAGIDTGLFNVNGGNASPGAGSYLSAARNAFDPGGGYVGYFSTNKGATYGSALLVPLLGGSGGGGIGGSPGLGGGGGGGAILIASSTSIDVFGTVRADGGEGEVTGSPGSQGHINPGSGGAIRLVAPNVTGAGILSANGPSTGNYVGNSGRVRIDSIDRRNLNLSVAPAAARSVGNFMVVFTSNRLDLINVAGTAIPEGSGPVTIQLPNGSSTNQTVTVQARNFNAVSLPIQIAVVPHNGPTVIYSTNINNSAGNNPATATVNIIVPVSTPVTVSAWTRVP